MEWFVLFVKSGKENQVVDFLNSYLNKENFLSFSLLIEYLYPRSTGTITVYKNFYPGYIFVESQTNSPDCPTDLLKAVKKCSDIFKILNYGHHTQSALHREERQFLWNLIDEEKCIQHSDGIIIDDKVKVIEGPLYGREYLIKKINRHKRIAWVECTILNQTHIIELPLNIVHKINT